MKHIIYIIFLVVTFSYSQNNYEVELGKFNSEVSDFGPAYAPDNVVVFASERDSTSLVSRRHKINGQLRPFLQLFTVENNDSLSVKRLKSAVNKKYHESTVAITNDGNTMYFTRNNYFNGKLHKSKNKISLLKLFKATKTDDGEWGNINELPFNSKDYSVGHPSLNKANNRLYFASDMPGTKGASDIYYVDIIGEDEYSEPVNLGGLINTEQRDTFPFISESGDLYFSSDRANGLGGLDVYVVRVANNYNTVHNLGTSLNSEQDDFAFIFNETDKTGYFSSNRENGIGDDDIYMFKELKPIEIPFEGSITGVVKTVDGKVIPETKITLKDENGTILNEVLTDENGKYIFNVNEADKTYTVIAEKDNFEIDQHTDAVTLTRTNKDVEIETVLKQSNATNITAISENGTVSKVFEPIYFSLNSAYLSKEAITKLDALIEYLNANPVTIQIESHTDARGSKIYNQRLSEKRSSSIKAYLIRNSISENRLIKKAFGESNIINECVDNVKCKDNKHRENRRSEFKVVN